MNKQLYRIVFNKARGMLMVVAETVSSQSATSSSPVSTVRSGSISTIVALKSLCFSLLLATGMVFSLVTAARADIIADPNAPKNQQPTILDTVNGLPLVNIQTPSAAGVSRNVYREFDVDHRGAVLNNARSNTQTQQGGWVPGNPWLAGGSARIILNEVNTSNPSQLRGYVEVAGDRAQVIIANPAGISCDGCGFINANRATLSTGSAILNGGSLEGYGVQQGNIVVSGAGMDGRQTDYTDLIARSVQLNAGIWANKLQVNTGASQVSADLSQSTALTPSAPAPQFLLDVASLGGMYAGKITLVGNEHGVGMRLAGQIGATAGDVVVTQDGRLENSGKISASGNLQVNTTGNVVNTGSMVASGNASIDASQAQISNQAGATLGALGDVTLHADSIDNQSTLAANGTLQLDANRLNNAATGSISASTTQLALVDTLDNRGLIDGYHTWLSANTINNLGTGRIYGDALALGAQTLSNTEENSTSAVIAARNRLDLGIGILNNKEHALIFSNGDMNIAGSLDANHHASGSADTLNNNSASIEALGNLSLAATTINNTNEHFAAPILPVGQPEHIIEYQGSGAPNRYLPGTPGVYIFNDESDHLMTPEGRYESWIKYDYNRNIQASTITETDPGTISAGGDMHIAATTVVNDKSHIIAGGLLSAEVQDLQNREFIGQHIVTDSGGVTSYWRDHKKGRDDTGSSWAAYTPPPVITDISLDTIRYQQNTAPATSSTQISDIGLLLPNSAIFHTSSNPQLGYLLETDPRFTNYKQWLSSDYQLKALSYDPATVQMRLGDGFYEQKLIREQVAQLTGRRFLDGYSNDEAQYRALLEQGATVAKAWNLRPGVALTAQQISQLTSDIVWLVEKDVTLPNGTVTKALVPQLYVQVKAGDLNGNGALIAGNALDLKLSGTLDNQGSIAGRSVVSLTANTVNNLGGRITGQDVAVSAATDLNVIGGRIDAANSLQATAGNDLNVTTTTRSNSNAQGSVTNLNRLAGLYVTNPTGATLVASAGHDLNLAAAEISNTSSGGNTVLAAGNNLNLTTVTTGNQQSIVWDGNNHRQDSSSQEVGSQVNTSGNSTLLAGNNLDARAATITSDQGALRVQAGNDIKLTAGTSRQTVDEAHQHRGTSSAFSSTTTTTRDRLDQTQAVATTLSGNTTDLQAAHDIAVTGSNVVSTERTTLQAGHDIAIAETATARQEQHDRKQVTSGLFSSGGFGITIGSREQGMDGSTKVTQATGSTIGAISGDVTLVAGQKYTQTGSSVLATGVNGGGDVNIRAKDIAITEARETTQNVTDTWFKQSGLTLALSSPVVNAIQTADQMSKAASHTSDSRMKALAAASTGMSAYSAYKAVEAGQGTTIDGKDNQIATGKTGADGKPETRDANSADKAGGVNLSISVGSSSNKSHSESSSDTSAGSRITAAGSINLVATGAGQDSNILIQGSDLKAAKDIALAADNRIQLQASQDADQQHGKNSGSSGSIGISFGTGGLMVNASVSKSRGHADGDSVSYHNSHLNAGDSISLTSGGDTTLKGAVVAAPSVQADVGGHLSIESLQDKDHYDSKQNSVGGSLSFGAGTMGGSLSLSQSKINSDYLSVGEQSGLLAGDGGFHVKVKGDTTLTGGVISSTEQAVQDHNNQFATGGQLAMTDLHNQADYNASSSSLNIGTSMNLQGMWSPSGSGIGFGNDSGSAGSDTRSGISGIAGNSAARTGDPQSGIQRIFDADKVQQDIDAQTLITQTFGQQASSAVGKYAETQIKQANALIEQAKQAHADGQEQQAQQLFAQAEQINQDWGEQGKLRIGLHTVIGGLTGGAAGAAGSLTGSLSAVEASRLLKENGITQENNPALYNTLVTLASSAAGGVVGGNAGTGAAFNEVTNNYLTPKQEFAKDAEKAACKGKLSCLSAVELKYGLISGKQNVGLLVGVGGGIGLQGYQQVENVVDMVANWSDTQKTLVALVNDPAFRSKVGDSIVQDYRQRIDLMTKAYNDGGWDGSVTAGVEAGRLAVDVVGAATAAMGAGKVAVTAAKAGANVAGQAITKTAAAVEASVGGLQGFNQLLKNGGLFSSNGKPLMDFRQLTSAQKSVVGDLLGSQKVQQLIPGAQEIGRSPGIGQSGIDGLYKVNKPGVDYVVIEYKFGSSKQSMTLDGLQGSDSWLSGANTNYNRILESVGNNPKSALAVSDALRNNRVEKWLVHTDPFGRVTVGVMGPDGKLIPNPEAASKLVGAKK